MKKLIDCVELAICIVGFFLVFAGIYLISVPFSLIFMGISFIILFSDFPVFNAILAILGRNKT